eukprot:CAMPEP_0113954278 /NCGR_PEP_ID=MMETSP0011_2-20120614/416_1 /TAXON_ID=101924 /ORGANISM="Rhodosorus marinus" /LENGTH=68 /DNA_ID=CAMNT_0000963293 /DNA_START=1282 /DNA_END=1488 /DNA_ORIENTATION=+ /assembly_acc=CAM_ASM_000156
MDQVGEIHDAELLDYINNAISKSKATVVDEKRQIPGFDLDRGKLGHGARIPRDRVETARGGREEGDVS